MKVQIKFENVELSSEQRNELSRKSRILFGRYGARIDRIRVRVRGSAGKQENTTYCGIHVYLPDSQVIVAEDCDSNAALLVDRLLSRTERNISRILTQQTDRA